MTIRHFESLDPASTALFDTSFESVGDRVMAGQHIVLAGGGAMVRHVDVTHIFYRVGVMHLADFYDTNIERLARIALGDVAGASPLLVGSVLKRFARFADWHLASDSIVTQF